MSGTISVEIPIPRILEVCVKDEQLTLNLEDGRVLSVPLVWYPRLCYGTEEERQNFQISGAGFGIHWPDLDEDIGVEGLLLGRQSTESAKSLAQWLDRKFRITPPFTRR